MDNFDNVDNQTSTPKHILGNVYLLTVKNLTIMLKLMNHLKNRFTWMRFRVPAVITLIGVLIATFAGAGPVFASTMSHVAVMETNMDTSGTSALIVEFTAGAND